MKTGAEAIIESLERNGTEVVFSYPGGAILPVYDELANSKIENILVRQEQGAVHAASGYARACGKTGVVIATSGPGATNLVTGIATANMDSIPIVLITGQVSTDLIGTDAFQETDITGITQPISKHNYLVKDAELLPEIIDEAFHIASTGRKGPVLIDVPKDIAMALCKGEHRKQLNLPGYQPTTKGSSKQIKKALTLIKEAQRPLIYAGGGVISANAQPGVKILAETINAPLCSTLMGLGALDSDHPLNLGMLGLHGRPGANYAISQCDLLIAIGCRFDDRVTLNNGKFADNTKIIHIDIDPAEIGKNILSGTPIVGDVNLVVEALNKKLEPKKSQTWCDMVAKWQELWPPKNTQFAGAVLNEVNAATPKDVIYTTDVGQHQMFAAQNLNIAAGANFISSGGLGTMGYGLPGAIGAKKAQPKKTVVAITGDGSFQMNFNELGTIAQENMDIKILLFNNSCLGMVRQLQHFYSDKKYYGVDLVGNPNFCAIAEAYGFGGYLLEDAKDIKDSVSKWLSHKGTSLLEVRVSKEDMVFPMVMGGASLDDMLLED
ncbi:MAG: biosynthetic-type acetolactate synthase large subunit [Clostridiales bacterium]